MATLTRVYLARHGETEWSRSGQHTGRTDIPLTPTGEDEARKLGERLHEFAIPHALTSPLQRARRTAELAGFGARVLSDDDLMEWNYGAYEGRRSADIRAERPDWNLWYDGCPGGEMPADVAARADRAIARLRALDGDAIIFSHGHFLRVFAARWLAMPPDGGRWFLLSTASLSIVGYEHDRLDEPVVRLWNETR